MTMLYGSCQRMVCIVYANEMSNACDAMGIDGFKVATVAVPKSFEYLLFLPIPAATCRHMTYCCLGKGASSFATERYMPRGHCANSD
jgi:hypothetical protein